MVCCCFSLAAIKCVLLLFNIVLAVGGGFLVFVGVVIQWNITEYGEFVSGFMSVPGYLLIGVGVALVIIAIVGFCGVVTGSQWIYVISLFILIVLEITGGVLAFTLQKQLDTVLMNTMKESMKLYSSPGPEGEVTRQTWNLIQPNFKCCGTEGPSDWLQVPLLTKPPDSCSCVKNENSTQCSSDGFYQQGCYTKVSHWFRLIESILGYLALSFAAVQLVMAIFVLFCGKGCCVC